MWAKMSGWIIAPAIAAPFVGRSLDEKFQTDQLFFITLMVLSFIVSIIGITKISKNYIAEMDKESEKLKQSKKQNDGNN